MGSRTKVSALRNAGSISYGNFAEIVNLDTISDGNEVADPEQPWDCNPG
jgi:hypothetical protein